MQQLNLKPNHKLVKTYYDALGQFGQLSIDHEMAVRSAFQSLLSGCGHQFDLTLVPEYSYERPKLHPIRIDGALLNPFRLARGYWEAKDEHDDLDKEIRAKLERGYPKNNIIFQAPERAVLYQHGIRQGTNEDIRDPKNLVELLKQFFAYREPHIEEWDKAVAEFKGYIPEIAKAVEDKIEEQRRTNPAFVERFDAFYEICRQSINPNLSVQAVEKMLVQHLLTERIFRRIFDNPDFTRRNVIAVEIEKVIDSMTRKEFSRDAFLKDLDRFYKAIELAAENTETYKEKQEFLNTVYERFFQGYSPKEADTHGIVYTPQPIVDFMVRSVEDILQKEFGRSLSDKDVHILDPFVGTGNFITRVMKEIKTSALPYKYENELHCNEVMLLPYYVASMNIEHEYMERADEYKPFTGICLVDTFDMRAQGRMFTEENLERIERQRQQPIFVIISNPPYNAWQVNENDNNKNRRYVEDWGVDLRVAETYGKESKATNTSALSDPYVKAFRWAADRIKEEGLIAFVTNSAFVDSLAADGMRKTLTGEFDQIYILDLGGNVRRNPRLSGTTHNVFGIQVGVSINLLVRRRQERQQRRCNVYYASVDEFWTRRDKYCYLDSMASEAKIPWLLQTSGPSATWLRTGSDEFAAYIPMHSDAEEGLFCTISNGVQTNRDAWVYNFSREALIQNVRKLGEVYNQQVQEIQRARKRKTSPKLDFDDKKIKWSSRLRENAEAGIFFEPDETAVRAALYRPFTAETVYFDHVVVHRPGRFPAILPRQDSSNLHIWLKIGGDWPSFCLASNLIADQLPQGGSQCFPFYTYDEDGSNRRENITDWALNEFRTHYSDPNITKWDIFHYVYAVLHHPEYRERYAANLKRELPRIPFVGGTASSVLEGAGLQASRKDALNVPSTLPKAGAQPGSPTRADFARVGVEEPKAERHKQKAGPSARAEAPLYPDGNRGSSTPLRSAQNDKQVFWAFVDAGRRLADLHVNYEQQPEYPLERIEKGQLNWRVEKMRLSKDKTTLVYNDFLTLKGIPPETYEYRLGNRSALEWVIDQYQVSTDKRSGIVNDPNRADDPEYIVRLIGQVITVSLETMTVFKGLPPLLIALKP